MTYFCSFWANQVALFDSQITFLLIIYSLNLCLELGLSADDLSKRLLTEVTIACYNSSDSVTVSGLPILVKNLIKILQVEGIFAREVNSSGYAFHSPYIAKAGPMFKSTLEKVCHEVTIGRYLIQIIVCIIGTHKIPKAR